MSMTFDDKVIVSHPSPEDPQINEDEDQSIPWYVAIRDLFEDTDMDKLVQEFTTNCGIKQIN